MSRPLNEPLPQATTGDNLYIGFIDPHYVGIVNLPAFTRGAELLLSLGRASALAISGNFLYVGIYGDPGYITKIDLTTFSEVATLTTSGKYITGFGISGNYLYAIFWVGTLVVGVSKIDLTTFTEVATLGLSQHSASCGVISGNYLYVGRCTAGTTSHLMKIDLTTFTEVASIVLAQRSLDSLSTDGTYIYGGGQEKATIHKVSIATFTQVDTLQLKTGDWRHYLLVVGSYLYSGVDYYYGTSPDEIKKIDLATFTEVDSLTLDTGEYDMRSLVTDNNFLYAAFMVSPGKVAKIDLATFTKVATLTFEGITEVTTDPATANIFPTSALNGTLDNDGGETCACGFEWGETVAYGNTTPTQSKTAGQTFSQTIGGLTPNTTYHFRAFATNPLGTVYGADRTFTTGIPFTISKAYALAREEL